MSTDLVHITNMLVNSFWGGVDRGPCVQVSLPNIEYEQLTHQEVVQLLESLFQWYFAYIKKGDKI